MDYTNLVFEGGGMKGVAYALIPQALEEYGILENIKKVAGSSAGSISATLIALRYSPAEINNIITNLKFSEFKDTRTYTRKVFKILTSYGINSGNYFVRWIKDTIRFKTGSRETTFLELFKLTDIELVITGTNVRTGITEYFSYKTTPSMPVWKAVRISITIPIFFKPIRYNDDLYIDGGILSNYPIWIFDNENDYNAQLDNYNHSVATLGFKLVSRVNKVYSDNRFFIPTVSIIIRLIFLMLDHIENTYNVFNHDSIEINTLNVSSTDFDLSDELIEELKKIGYNSTCKFLKNQKTKSVGDFSEPFEYSISITSSSSEDD